MSNQRQGNNRTFREKKISSDLQNQYELRTRYIVLLRIHSKWMLGKGDHIMKGPSYTCIIVVTNV